jgi:hypothetical protein
MSWQKRRNTNYFYRSRREGKRVVADYFGAGPTAHVQAEMDARDRAEEKAQRDRTTAIRQQFQEADAPFNQFSQAMHLLEQAVLLSEGFYQHDRGSWQRRAWAYVQRSTPSTT